MRSETRVSPWLRIAKVAAVATALTMVLGTLAAAAVYRSRFFGRETVSLLLILPVALPGISLRSAFNLMEIPFSFWTIVLGHATFCIVVVYNNVIARLRRTSMSLIEASMNRAQTASRRFVTWCCPTFPPHCLPGRCWHLRCRSTK